MTKPGNSLVYFAGGALIVAVAAFIFFSQSNSGQLNAQNLSCDDPFAGENIRFETRYWELTDFCQHSVPYSEIRSGGPPPDGIPPIDNPQFEPVESAQEWLQDQSPVISVEIDGIARAYPLGIMTRHEIVNDEFDGRPVAVTYCPLCNSAIVFDRVVEGQTLRFGVSGNLRNSDLIMWDNVTESWWQQFTGEAIVGEFTGTQLDILPSVMVGFGAFVAQHPDGMVLSRTSGSLRNPYTGYDSDPDPFLFDGEVDDRLPATERVLAGIIGGEPMAYPFARLAEERVINDTIGEREVVAFWQPGKTSALDRSNIDESRDVGMAALYRRTLDDQTLTFSIDEDGVITDDQTGSTWNVFGTATGGELEGAQLQTELAAPHFWFAWAAFRPETAVYGLTE